MTHFFLAHPPWEVDIVGPILQMCTLSSLAHGMPSRTRQVKHLTLTLECSPSEADFR